MYLILFCALFFLVSLICLLVEMGDGEGRLVFFWVSVGLLIIVVFVLILNPILINAEILQFKSVGITLETARRNPEISKFELAAIQQKVVEMNKWLANAKFWAKHPLTNWFWPKEISRLEPII